MARQLAAILLADVVGYASLMEADEAGTLHGVQAAFETAVTPAIAAHDGRVVKTMGDGLLALFPSVIEAVAAALDIQRQMAARDTALKLRIGIALGDVILRDGDVFGDGVNLAARLEAEAEPGGICVSDTVAAFCRGKVAADFHDLGQRSLKGIAAPTPVFAVRHAEAPPPATAPVPQPADDPFGPRPAVAVLPFENRSNDPEQEYFSDGVTEDIITALSHWRSFPVIARSSSFAYKGRQVGLQEIAADLKARYVISGSIRRMGQRLRVSAELTDAATGHALWAERFDSEMADIFALQDRLVEQIVSAISPEITRAEATTLADRRPENLTAWDLFLRGSAELYRLTAEGNEAARQYFQRAIDLEPAYGEAWAGYGHSFLRDLDHGRTGERARLIDDGFAAAERAAHLAPMSSYVQVVLATAHVWKGDLEQGIALIRRAIELNPYNAHAHMALGNRLDLAGQTREGIDGMERALALNPRDPHRALYAAYLSRANLVLGERERALAHIEEALTLQGDNPDLHFRRAVCLAALDRVDTAREALAACERLDRGFTARRAAWRPYRDDARNAVFFEGMRHHSLLDGL